VCKFLNRPAVIETELGSAFAQREGDVFFTDSLARQSIDSFNESVDQRIHGCAAILSPSHGSEILDEIVTRAYRA
jgi:hypothetical protein